MANLHTTIILVGVLVLLGNSLQCTKESLAFDEHMLVPRSQHQIAMDRFVPIHAGEHSEELGDYHPMLIHYDTSALQNLQKSDPAQYQFLNNKLVPALVRHLSQTFKVREIQENRVSVDTCGKVKVMESLKREIKADLILIFTVEGKKTDSFVAYASACQLHKTTLRPTVGRVNMNPFHLSSDPKVWYKQFTTVLHEAYHIMGFSKSLYQYYLDPVTLKRKKESDTYIVQSEGKFPYVIRSPKVLAHAREYFKCPKLDGVPVEDDGGSGSAGSHWEKVVLGNEIMVPNVTANLVVSKFTLKLMEDSGWYQVNYNMAEPFFWGIRAGCSIVEGDCYLHGHKCEKKGEQGCFYDYTYQANCSSDKFQNMCSFFTGTDQTKHDCRQPSNRDGNSDALGEYFGLRSRCFTGRLVANGYYHGNMCYHSYCESGKVKVKIGSKVYDCLSSGQKIQPTGMKGYVTCPDIRDFCEQQINTCQNDCSMNGRCQLGKKCWCYPGFQGENCSQSAVASRAKPAPTKKTHLSIAWWDRIFHN